MATAVVDLLDVHVPVCLFRGGLPSASASRASSEARPTKSRRAKCEVSGFTVPLRTAAYPSRCRHSEPCLDSGGRRGASVLVGGFACARLGGWPVVAPGQVGPKDSPKAIDEPPPASPDQLAELAPD